MLSRLAPFALVVFLGGAIYAVSLAPGLSRPVAAPQGATSASAIAWQSDFDAAMKEARETQRPVMISFYTDWCGACKIMDAETFTAPTVVAESQNWIPVKVNAEARQDLAQAYGVTGFPTIVWARGDGQPVLILPGGLPAKEFAEAMQEARKRWQA